MCQFANYSRRLYSDLDAYNATGLLELATTDTRWAAGLAPLHLQSRLGHPRPGTAGTHRTGRPGAAGGRGASRRWGLHPHLRADSPGRVPRRAAQGAEARGRTFHGGTEATDIETDGDGLTAVVTDLGRVVVELVHVVTDNWAPLFDRMFGMDLPLMPCKHLDGVHLVPSIVIGSVRGPDGPP